MNHPNPTDPLTSTADAWRDPSIHVPVAVEPYSIAFHSVAQRVMIITKEGCLVPGVGLSSDEATQAMFKVLTKLWKDNNAYLAGLERDAARLRWLHTGGGKDSEGYEWGVARVKHDENGRLVSALWTASDHSDLDAEMAREG